MLQIREAIVVEGRYDKIALEPLVDTVVLITDGFGIFRNTEKMALLRRIAETRGLIVLTDSDGAGLVIRNRIRGSIDGKYLKHAYIPDIPGKERRKKTGSKAGTLGVEGMKKEVLENALRRAGATFSDWAASEPITKADFASLGLSGATDSSARRYELQKSLGLPKELSSNALLDAVNSLYTRDEFLSAVSALQDQRDCISENQNGTGI